MPLYTSLGAHSPITVANSPYMGSGPAQVMEWDWNNSKTMGPGACPWLRPM